MKKRSLTLLTTFLLMFAAFTLNAAQDTSNINISATFVEYVRFTGTAVDSDIYFDVDDLAPTTVGARGPRVSLGTLGLESSNVGLCDLAVTTANSFRLRHTVSNVRLSGYRLWYLGQRINRNNPEMTIPCNSVPTDIEIQVFLNFLTNPQAGVYQDVVTLTITTQ